MSDKERLEKIRQELIDWCPVIDRDEVRKWERSKFFLSQLDEAEAKNQRLVGLVEKTANHIAAASIRLFAEDDICAICMSEEVENHAAHCPFFYLDLAATNIDRAHELEETGL